MEYRMTRLQLIDLVHHLVQEAEHGNPIIQEDWNLIYSFIETERSKEHLNLEMTGVLARHVETE